MHLLGWTNSKNANYLIYFFIINLFWPEISKNGGDRPARRIALAIVIAKLAQNKAAIACFFYSDLLLLSRANPVVGGRGAQDTEGGGHAVGDGEWNQVQFAIPQW